MKEFGSSIGLSIGLLLLLSGCTIGENETLTAVNPISTEVDVIADPVMAVSAERPLKKKKLQIVFCFGQSNMVGLSDVRTASYLLQPQYVPPREVAVMKTDSFDWDLFYWQGVKYYQGPYKQELDELLMDRRYSRMKWRQRHRGVLGPWKTEEWGPKPKGGKGNMYPFLAAKAEEEGIYPRMRKILDSDDNAFNVYDAYNALIKRDEQVQAELQRIRDNYLNGATEAQFQAFNAAVKDAIDAKRLMLQIGETEAEGAEKYRRVYAELAHKYLGMPIAKRTYIKAHGHVTGPQSNTENAGNQRNATGRLSVGYGGKINTIGPEYGVGIALERLVDAPILLVKCSWGNTSIADAWRAPSLDGVETPMEKAQREAHNKRMSEMLKDTDVGFTPSEPKPALGKLRYSWSMTFPEVDKVLDDPGQYHPEYDPEVGYELAGLVWFQGYSDKGNPAYGELLAAMIEDFRKKVNAPDLPVVCGTLGMDAFPHTAFSNGANAGMLQVSQMPDFAGTVDVVNTAPYYPLELDLIGQVLKNTEKDSAEYKEASFVKKRATSNKGFHYHGSAKCFLLMGDAMGRSLANLMAGGEPFINQEMKQ